MKKHKPGSHGFVNEFKTYKCNTCGYSADVYGEPVESLSGGILDTHVCLNCMHIIEVEIAAFDGFETVDGETITNYKEATPVCLLCDKSDTIKWDKEICKCPKCNGKMELSRLDLFIYEVGTYKIK